MQNFRSGNNKKRLEAAQTFKKTQPRLMTLSRTIKLS